MSYQMEWKVDKRVVLITYDGSLFYEDTEHFVIDLNTMLEEGIAPVHVIDDLSNLDKLPTNIAQMRELAKQFKGDNAGWFVMIQGNRLVGFLANVISQILGIHTTKRDSVEDAMDFLVRHDKTLNVEEVQQ